MNRKERLVSSAPTGRLRTRPKRAKSHPTVAILCQRRTSSSFDREYPSNGGIAKGRRVQLKRMLAAKDRQRWEKDWRCIARNSSVIPIRM